MKDEWDSCVLAHLAGRRREDPLLARLVRRAPDIGEVTADRLFRSLLRGMPVEGVEVLARPRGHLQASLRPGDVLLRVALGEPGLGHAAVIADGELRSPEEARLAGLNDEEAGPGRYAHVVEAGAVPHTWRSRFARRVLDAQGRVPSGQMLVRPVWDEPDESANWTCDIEADGDVRGRIVAAARRELERWDGGTRGETEPAMTTVLRDYWRNVGLSPAEADRMIRERQPWSAAFVSWVIEQAGAGSTFRKSAGHYQYVAAAKQNRLRGDTARPFWAYRIGERAPEPGDLVCKARPAGGACSDISFDNVDDRTARSAHCDIVAARRGEEITVVGGNLGDSAKSYAIRTSGGLLPATDRDGCRYFAVIVPDGGAELETRRPPLPPPPAAVSDTVEFFKDVPRLQSVALEPASPLASSSAWDALRRRIAGTFNRLGGLLQALAEELRIEIPGILAVWIVESGGWRHVPGRMVIRFENHVLFTRWGKRNAALYDQHFTHGGHAGLPPPAYKHHQFREDPTAGFRSVHDGEQETEYQALRLAQRLAGEATALQCISMGGPQIMGFHYADIGYRSPREMYDAFQRDERSHVLGFFDFIRTKRAPRKGDLIDHMRAHRWREFARGYNGSGKEDEYGMALERNYTVARTLVPAAASTEAEITDYVEPVQGGPEAELWEQHEEDDESSEDLAFEDSAPTVSRTDLPEVEDFRSVEDEEDEPEPPQTAPASSPASATPSAKKWPRVVFEFDVHFGFLPAVDTIISQTSPFGVLTTHTQAVDLFDVKRDINRLEIGTDKFALSPKGLEKLETAKTNIAAFVGKLATGCSAARQRTDVRVAGLDGHPRLFPLPDANTSAASALIHKLPNTKEFPTSCGVWASPQAHITIPLAKVGELVTAIKNSIGKPDGEALTGSSPQRMGLRSDHLFKAKAAVEALRKKVIAAGHTLSNSVAVDATTFTDDLAGLLILQGSYLWVRDLAEPADYERFGKGHLPINVKTPFSEIFTDILTDTERKIYKEILAGPAVRTAMFGLVRTSPSLSDGSTKLFPDVVFFSSFTWDDLLDWTLGTKSVSGLPGGGTVWPASKTKPRVALELRRIGFKALGASKWNTLIDTIVGLTKKLNGL